MSDSLSPLSPEETPTAQETVRVEKMAVESAAVDAVAVENSGSNELPTGPISVLNADTQAPVLEMRGIVKRFGGVTALGGVSLSLSPGEIVAVIGENGAGKSTLMKTLGGVHQPDEGEITIDGQPRTIRSVSDATGYGIAFIHQELNVLDNLDVGANVYLGREPRIGGPLNLIDRGAIRRQTQVYLQQLGLDFSPDTPLTNLSLAEQQMVEIAKALSLDARILIMDEPTSSLTLKETARLLEVTKDLRAKGVAILYISHRLGEIIDIADRVVALRDGENAGGLRREEITHDRMVSLMVGRDLERMKVPHKEEQGEDYLCIEKLRTPRYPDSEVTFAVRTGEILGFAGLVGAGRTEVAEAIFGVDPALSGTIRLGDSEPLVIRSAKAAIGHGIYLIPEDRRKSGLILEWPIRDNISLPAIKRNASGGWLLNGATEQSVAEEQAQSLQIKTPSVSVPAGNLSGGNQQKVVLGKWLSMGPRALIFDEPTRGIDVGAKAEIYKLMRALADEGVAIMMISSDMEEVLNVSDRIAVMCEGDVTGFLTRAEASEEAIMNLAVAKSKELVK